MVDLFKLQPDTEHPHGLSDRDFDSLFTVDKPIIFAFHGYPWLIHRLAYRRTNHANLHVRGYKEKGNINTPLELAIQNQIDRFTLAMDVIDRVPRLQVAGAHAKEKFRNMQIECRELRARARRRPPGYGRLALAGMIANMGAAIARFRGLGWTVIVSDGDVVFQPRKGERRHSAERYVLVDDKLRTLTAVTNVRGERATTVLPRQGKFANDPHVLASCREADVDDRPHQRPSRLRATRPGSGPPTISSPAKVTR